MPDKAPWITYRPELTVLDCTIRDGGLVSDGAPRGFELAGDDGVFHNATARLDGDAVLLRCAAVLLPKQVRYAWAAVPDCSLANGAGLPAWPFASPVP